jgi:SAM-dependent methyltransferase
MTLVSRSMVPNGMFAHLFGAIMERLNGKSYLTALELLAPKPNERFLEIGFGTGKFAELLLTTDRTVYVAGVDPSLTMLDIALSRRGIMESLSRTDLRDGDDSKLFWPDGYFDGIIAIHSFQFWPDPGKTVSKISNLLSPFGRLLLILRNHTDRIVDSLPNPISRSSTEMDDTIMLLEEHGFKVSDVDYCGRSQILFASRLQRQTTQ